MLNLLTSYFLVASLLISNGIGVKGQRDSEGDKGGDSEGDSDNSDVESAVTTEHSGDEESEQDEGTADGDEDRTEGRSGHGHDSMKPIKVRPTRRRAPVETQEPLYCYACKYKHNATNDLCLNPAKNELDAKECKVKDSQCFTYMEMSEDDEDMVKSVVRGCKTNCGSSREFTCCDTPLCNSQVFMMMMSHAAHSDTHIVQAPSSLTSNAITVVPHSVMLLISVLLLAWRS